MKDISEASSPVSIDRKLLEKDVQKMCVDWARKRGYWARKFSSQSQRSVPDYLFSREWKTRDDKHGTDWAVVKFATEFKKPGTKPKLIEKYGIYVMSTEAQYEEQVAMRVAGWFVFECDNFDKFKATVIAYEQECA